MRLDHFVAKASGLSRKDAKRAIGRGAVSVDGSPCRQAASQVAPTQTVCLDGQPLSPPGPRYLMLNKPVGVVSSTGDEPHPSALSLIPAELRPDLRLVGRLDLDTTGLLLLTNDGQWSHRVTSPRRRCPKTYRVTLADAIAPTALEQLRQGVELRNDPQPTAPAEVIQLGPRSIELTLVEGRYHQVKRMLAAVGNRVVGLHRTRIGDIQLDPALAPGEFRPLTEAEVGSVGGT
ncbi:MAG: pseudouridine synthase [Marinobacter sp.]|uniref:pseudouridine synthase n=1 Tax=Marinobacter sp. TaxID=50741 RepID=UPI00299EFBC2|nr:pseudouridine synthase [Marinobacter sp.]MDX1756354.1 pseudouridine synthase [Marinobacter sp.]